MHPGQETTSFSMGKGQTEGGCTEHHANSVWDQPRARARRRERRGEGTGPSFGRETANRSGSPRLFLPPSMRSHSYFCASVRANTVSQPACSQSPSFAGFVLRWSKPESGWWHIYTSTRSTQLAATEATLSLPTSSLMFPWLVAGLTDMTETTALSKQGIVFCLISELKRTTL